jgi:hypothetical protein
VGSLHAHQIFLVNQVSFGVRIAYAQLLNVAGIAGVAGYLVGSEICIDDISAV